MQYTRCEIYLYCSPTSRSRQNTPPPDMLPELAPDRLQHESATPSHQEGTSENTTPSESGDEKFLNSGGPLSGHQEEILALQSLIGQVQTLIDIDQCLSSLSSSTQNEIATSTDYESNIPNTKNMNTESSVIYGLLKDKNITEQVVGLLRQNHDNYVSPLDHNNNSILGKEVKRNMDTFFSKEPEYLNDVKKCHNLYLPITCISESKSSNHSSLKRLQIQRDCPNGVCTSRSSSSNGLSSLLDDSLETYGQGQETFGNPHHVSISLQFPKFYCHV